MKSSNFSPSRSIFVLILLCAAISVAAPAQTFTVLDTLTFATNGQFPTSPLIQGLDGNLYGTAQHGGAYSAGTFFQVTPSGTLTVLYNFCPDSGCSDGLLPTGPVVLGVDGNFYGTTLGQGPLQDESYGTIYKITPAGSLTTLYEFDESCKTDYCSANPNSGLTLARNGAFYGVSASPSRPATSDGLIFKFSSSGTFTPLLVVCPDLTCPTDAGPAGAIFQNASGNPLAPGVGVLLQASGGSLIGPGPGGANGEGAIYEMTASGAPTILYSYCEDKICHDGDYTTTPLAEAAGGDFYGMNLYGGSGAHCTFDFGCGTLFRVTRGGTLTKLHDFCSWAACADGAGNNGNDQFAPTDNALIQATDGNFYGITFGGGAGEGTIFRLTPSGHFTLLHTFTGADGVEPLTGLYQATDGNLYGTTTTTIFRLSLGLAPFVRTVQNFGAVGASVIILGNNLTGATGVTFNGATAAFSVVSATEITATVPAGASTGSIQVVTAGGGTLSSNVAFVVLP